MTAKESSFTLNATELSALVASAVTAALAEKKPITADDLIKENKAAILARATHPIIGYLPCIHNASLTRFTAICVPKRGSPESPDWTIFRADDMRTDLEREKQIYSNALAGEDHRFRALAMAKKFGGEIDLSGPDRERLELDMTQENYRLAAIDSAIQNAVKQQRLMTLLQPVRHLVGMTISQARAYATIPATYTVIDPGHGEGVGSPCPWPLPPQGA